MLQWLILHCEIKHPSFMHAIFYLLVNFTLHVTIYTYAPRNFQEDAYPIHFLILHWNVLPKKFRNVTKGFEINGYIRYLFKLMT